MRMGETALTEDGAKHRQSLLDSYTGRLTTRSIPVFIPSMNRSITPPSWWDGDEQDIPIILAPLR